MAEVRYVLSAEAAEFYESTFVPALFAAWARRLVDTVEPAPGQTVLDVACGTGVVARTIADRTLADRVVADRAAADQASAGPAGASGAVVGVDLNASMLAVARRIRPDLRWQLGDACALPFGDGSFDLVLSQAGLMFFGDRVAALREMGRVARGRVAVQVPGRLSASPGYRALTDAVARHAGTEALDLLAAYFAVGEPDLLARLFDAAGLRVDRFETWLGATRLESVDTFLTVELLPIADRLDPGVRARIVEDCHTTLAPFVDAAGAIAAPIEVQLVVGRRR